MNAIHAPRRALLVVNTQKDQARELAGRIAATLKEQGVDTVSRATDASRPARTGACDIAFSLGGDGTVLFAARVAAPLSIPILPVNLGTLGFIAAVQVDAWQAAFQSWLEGTAAVSRRLMLTISVERKGGEVFRSVCLNDAVISGSGMAKLINLKVDAEIGAGAGGHAVRIMLGQYRADGLIVATPTGSTAYSLSAGGPLFDPEMEALIINPICPFTLSIRPLVVPADETVIVEIAPEQRSEVLLSVDGQLSAPLLPGDRVFIRKAPFKAALIASGRQVFYNVLRDKLNWSGGTDA
jgi:NAD+ kinase